MAIITTAPTMTLTKAAAWAAYLAPNADLDPIRLPTLFEAATPIPNGIVLRTIISESMISIIGSGWSTDGLWSVVIMTDCAARGIEPRRPAASATISNAALETSVKNLSGWSRIPFRPHHQNPGKCKLQTRITALRIKNGP